MEDAPEMETRAGFQQQFDSLADLIRRKPRALTVRDLAQFLSVSERLIYRMAAERIIPSFRICGSVRFDPSAIASWLSQAMSDSTSCRVFQIRDCAGRTFRAKGKTDGGEPCAISQECCGK
jgi:excisionase family DNA binding protein